MSFRTFCLILLALVVAGFFAEGFYQRSLPPYYGEAEPLYPTVAEFGRELVKLKSGDSVSPADIKALLAEERFEAILPYGVVFADDSNVLVTIRINKKFSFEISQDGAPSWKENE